MNTLSRGLVSLVVCSLVAFYAVPAVGAGNVQASVKKGKLVVSGDDAANDITITSDFNVDPEDFVTVFGNAGTTVNGGSSFVAKNVTGEVRVTLRDGDDVLAIGETLDFPRGLRIATGDGADAIDLTDTRTTTRLTINTGDGNDTLTTAVAVAGTSLSVNLGDDDDTFVASDALEAATKIKVATGSGVDVVALDAPVSGKLVVRTGRGNDTVAAETTFHDKVDVNLGGDDDEFSYQSTTFEDDVKLNGGGGTDTLSDLGGNTANGEFKVKSFEVMIP